jgi:hypothetical protein
MFTFTLASLFLFLLERSDRRPRLLLWIPPLFLLWLNLHAGFALGLALLFLYAVGLIFEAAAGTTSWQQARLPLIRLFFIAVACLALVPLNPSGVRLYLYPLETLRSSAMRSFIVEWFSPDFHQWMYAPCLLVILLLVAGSRLPIRGRVLLPLAFLFLSALDATRHIPIFMLVVIPVIAGWMSHLWPAPQLPVNRRPGERLRPAFQWASLVLLAVFALARWINLGHNQDFREAEQFPQKAVTFLQAGNLPSRLFIYYDWGGYAIWKLYPQYRVFVDGRADLYGDELLQQSNQTLLKVHKGWQAVLDTWNVQTILIPPGSPLAQALVLDPHWSAPYRDPRAVIFVRSSSRPGDR